MLNYLSNISILAMNIQEQYQQMTSNQPQFITDIQDKIQESISNFFLNIWHSILEFICLYTPQICFIIAYLYICTQGYKIFLYTFFPKENDKGNLILKITMTPFLYGVVKLFFGVIQL